MTDTRLYKLFAWVIGVLCLLWLLAECLGGVDEADPRYEELERDSDGYAADCGRAWEALDLVGTVNEDNAALVVDQIESLGTAIEDPGLKSLAAGYAARAEDLAGEESSGAALEEARAEFRDTAAIDLSMSCPMR
jgi:hypothetical protein